ncbi:hypothetical protein LPTSP4_15950 [Leptospira ryugenii]|uniref:Phosphorylase n=1 Tax=Leptospira ryugenii TaxID=1917863 RepID=A0A2P2DZL1_9LEPT|nr:phosphorylase [Leptospira ryugenii]GBF50072.1 hypothetical protein LPTSP4_15950 [Leptospira ryugenii]
MAALFFALLSEANPWIRDLKASPLKQQGHFRRFESDLHQIIVTGPGKLAMASAVTEYCLSNQEQREQTGFQILNIGIAGSPNIANPVGDFFWINRIHDQSMDRDFFPERILGKFPAKEANLLTVDQPISRHFTPKFVQLSESELSQWDLIDMEASGFFYAASLYVPIHQIFVGKMVSDHLEGTMCSPKEVESIVESHIETVKEFINITDSELADRLEKPIDFSDEINFAKHLQFTESMLHDLKDSLMYFHLRYPKQKIPRPQFETLQENWQKRDAKNYLKTWKALLYA